MVDGGGGVDTADFSVRTTPVIINGGSGSDAVRRLRAFHRRHRERLLPQRRRPGRDVRRRPRGRPRLLRQPRPSTSRSPPTRTASPTTARAGEGDNIDATVENIIGGAGNDTLGGRAGVANVLDGGAGVDTATYAGRADGVAANLDGLANDGATGENDQLIGFEALAGGNGNDFLTGSPAGNTLSGGPGNDVLDGGDGADSLSGQDGNDQLTGGSGVDGYAGGEGDDNVTAFDGLAESVDCGAGTDGAAVDVADTLANCENVRKLDEILDVDRDGSLPRRTATTTTRRSSPGRPTSRATGSTRTAPARTRSSRPWRRP